MRNVLKKLQDQLSSYFNLAVLKPVGQVMGSQLLLQVVGFGIGIILVRDMPKTDYAIYTILMSVQAILTILSNSGIMIGFIKTGGDIWDDSEKLATLIKTGTQLRYYIAFFAFLIAGFYGIYLLIEQNIESFQILIFLVCIILIVIPEIHTAFITNALLLRKEVMKVQLAQLITQSSRLLLLLLVLLIFRNHLTINIVLIITISGIWLSYWFLIKKSTHIIDHKAPFDPKYRRILLHYLKRIWHNELFFAFHGQISIFLIGVFGSTSSLADLGALARLAAVYAILTALINNLIVPRFARAQETAIMKLQYFQLLALLGLSSVSVIFMAYIFPEIFLWILGPKYYHLELELTLVMILGSVNLFISGIVGLNQAKGWIKFRTFWEIPLNILTIILGIRFFDISILSGVLYLSISISAVNLLLSLVNSYWGFSRTSQKNSLS